MDSDRLGQQFRRSWLCVKRRCLRPLHWERPRTSRGGQQNDHPWSCSKQQGQLGTRAPLGIQDAFVESVSVQNRQEASSYELADTG